MAENDMGLTVQEKETYKEENKRLRLQIDSMSNQMDTGIGAAQRESELLMKNQSLAEKIRMLEQQLADEKVVRKHTSNDL